MFQGICGLHFADDAYISSDLWRKEMNFAPKKRQLKEGAIPTLNLMSKVEDYVIRYMKRVTMKTPSGEEIKTNKIRVEVGPLYGKRINFILLNQLFCSILNCCYLFFICAVLSLYKKIRNLIAHWAEFPLINLLVA